MTDPNILKYTTEVKGPVTAERAIAVLQDHEHFFVTDPNLVSFRATSGPPDGSPPHALPADAETARRGDTRFYEVVDRMPGVALFARLLRGFSTITSHYEITDTVDGAFLFLHAPMGVTEERRWVVVCGGEGGSLKIVEQVTIFCSKLLYSAVKSQQDQHWKNVHAANVREMGGEVGEQYVG